MMRRQLFLACLLAAALHASAGAAEPAEPLGRLFFTPAQRAALDAARAQRARGALATKSEEEAQPVPEVITYGGMIRRSDGRTTIWINNRALEEGAAGVAEITGRARPDGSLLLQVPQSGRAVELKVGQSVELLTGTVEEGYARRTPPKPEAKPVASKPESGPSPAAKPESEAKSSAAPKPRFSRARGREEPEELAPASVVAPSAFPASAAAPPPAVAVPTPARGH